MLNLQPLKILRNFRPQEIKSPFFKKEWLIIFTVLIAGISICSCGGGGTSSGGSGNNSLTVNLTDSPFSDAKSVLVTFSQVQVHTSGGTFVTVPFAGGGGSRTCDLKKLVGSQDVLGTGPLPAGHYTMIRLVVSQSTLFFDNQASGPACDTFIAPPAGMSAPMVIPSGDVRLNREFDLTTTRPTTILLDFDGGRSIIQTGNNSFMMNPVIGIVSVQ